jgi:hypothetical protein
VNERVDISVTFSGVDPLPLATIAEQITFLGTSSVTAYVNSNGKLVFQTRPVGGSASLRIVGGDAAGVLGLPTAEPDSLAFGYDPRIVLVPGVSTYSFQDYYSDASYFYKVRFSHSLTGIKSDFSEPISATQVSGIDPTQIVLGFVRLARHDGRPSANQEVTVYSTFLSQSIQGYNVLGGPQRFSTDATGYVEFPLIRGLTVDVSITGTAYIRRVTAPADFSILRFNVLDPQYGKDDSFAVQRAEIPYAERKTF